jgi:hypothetical protein
MRRFLAAACGWRAVVIASALLIAALALPALGAEGPLPGSKNKNLTATAQYSASTEWQSDQGNTTFVAAKSFDGDYTTRWNVDSGDNDGSWIAANWSSAVTVNKVVVYEAFDRLNGFRVQKMDPTATDWSDAYVAEDAGYAAVKGGDPNNPKFTIRFPQAFQTKGIRILFTQTNNAPSIFEVEAWNNPSGTITGTVTDPSGKPVAGATVTAGSDSATTDANGKYTLITDAGTYNVTAGKTGAYRNRIARGIVLPANGSASHDFVLLPLPPNLSLTATAASSSDYSGGTTPQDYNAAKANDGNLTTRWNSDSGDTDGAWLEMKWSQPQTFNKVTIREAIDRIRNYSLQTYDATNAKYVDIPGASNVNVPSPAGSSNPVFTHILPQALTSTRLRLLINHADDLPSVWELEVANAPTATVAGVVKDVASGSPVANAVITTDLGVKLGTSDSKGQFSLLVEPDDYVISASAPGYFQGAPDSFTINAGDTQNITLTAPAQGPDIAKGAKAVASSEDPSYPATMVNDGDLTTYWQANSDTQQWIGVTWDKPTHLTVVQLHGFVNTIQNSYLQILDTDGKTWVNFPGPVLVNGQTQQDTTIAPEFLSIAQGAAAADTVASFQYAKGVTTTGVRYFITATNSAGSNPGVYELLVFDSPIPQPAQ